MATKPKLANPAAPKGRVITPAEAADILEKIDNPTPLPAEPEEFFDEDNEADETEAEAEEAEAEAEEARIEATKDVRPRHVKSNEATSNIAKEKEDFFAEMESLGRDQGKAINSLIAAAEKMVYAGASGLIDDTEVKTAYIRFRKGSNTSAGKNSDVGDEDHTITSNTSKLRSFYKVGKRFKEDGWTKMLRHARDIHVSYLRNKETRKMLKPALVPTYEALVKVASTQVSVKRDAAGNKHDIYPDLLTHEQIREIFLPADAQRTDPTVPDVIEAAAKAIERVIKGKMDDETNEVIRPAFEKNATVEDTVDYALACALDWVLTAGEIFHAGFRKERDAAIAEAKKKAEERHAAAEAKRKKEEEEKAARAAVREEEKRKKAAEKQLAAEAAKEKAA